MLTQQRRTVLLSLTAMDLAIAAEVEAIATVVQNDATHFHLLLPEAVVKDFCPVPEVAQSWQNTVRLLWLELSPSRVAMTMQGAGQFSYRHAWTRGLYGSSQYWLHSDTAPLNQTLQLRNYTRSLALHCQALPQQLYIDYELWAGPLRLGRYALNLEVEA
jgi:hypothetical protein